MHKQDSSSLKKQSCDSSGSLKKQGGTGALLKKMRSSSDDDAKIPEPHASEVEHFYAIAANKAPVGLYNKIFFVYQSK